MKTISIDPIQEQKTALNREKIVETLQTILQNKDAFSLPLEGNQWIELIQDQVYQNTAEKVSFLKELIKLVANTAIPLQQLQTNNLFQLHRILRSKDKPEEVTSDSIYVLMKAISQEIDLTIASPATCQLAYQLLGRFSVPMASLLLKYSQTAYYIQFFKPTRLYELSAFEQGIILQLIKKKVIYNNHRYTGLGIALLQDITEKEKFVPILETFLEKVVPQILQRLELKDSPSGAVLFYWFAMWVHHQYPKVYNKPRLEKISTLNHIPFSKILAYIPRVLLANAADMNNELFLHVATGKSIRTFPSFKNLSKRTIHEYLNLGKDQYRYDIFESFLLSVDTPTPLITTLAARIKDDYRPRNKKEAYQKIEDWQPFVLKLNQWYATTLEVEKEELDEILSYFQHCIDEKLNLVLKGRTLVSMKRIVAEWHFRNQLEDIEDKSPWEGADYNEWTLQNEKDTFTIVQLLTPKALIEEGMEMRHCAADYYEECRDGTISMWSLRQKKELDIFERLVTIEVNEQRQITQMRSKYNRSPNPKYVDMIQVWANENQLINR